MGGTIKRTISDSTPSELNAHPSSGDIPVICIHSDSISIDSDLLEFPQVIESTPDSFRLKSDPARPEIIVVAVSHPFTFIENHILYFTPLKKIIIVHRKLYEPVIEKKQLLQSVDYLYIDENIDYVFLNKLIRHYMDRLQLEVSFYGGRIATTDTPDTYPGISPFAENLRKQLSRYALEEIPIFILGPVGTGKSWIARIIHQLGPNGRKEPVLLDCNTLNINLIESELFGYTRGAFTGALKDHKGLFFQAHNNTLIMENISDLPLSIQSKLLHVLEVKTFSPLGSNKTYYSNFKLISTSRHSLQEIQENNILRKDLLYRINAITLVIPPLSERKKDIWPSFEYLLHHLWPDNAKPFPEITHDFIREAEQYPWPGNLKEMDNFIKKLVLLSPGKLTAEIFHSVLLSGQIHFQPTAGSYILPLEQIKKSYSKFVVNTLGLSRKEAAKLLQVDPRTLEKLLKDD